MATIHGIKIVKRESDAWAVYDSELAEIVAYAPGMPWSLSKSKAPREHGTGHKCYYIGMPDVQPLRDQIERDILDATETTDKGTGE